MPRGTHSTRQKEIGVEEMLQLTGSTFAGITLKKKRAIVVPH